MESVESELQSSAEEVLTSLRNGSGLDSDSSERLKRALRAAAASWSNASTVSKSAANLFVDLSSGIEACSYAYSGEEAKLIKALSDEIAALVRACVGV